MKTRWEMCVLTLLALLTLTSLSNTADQPETTRVFGRTPSGPGSSSQPQANPGAPNGPAQAANGHSITGDWQGRVATQHLIVKIDRSRLRRQQNRRLAIC